MRHSQKFHQIDSFLKLVLNILRNLVVGWERGLLKRGLGRGLLKRGLVLPPLQLGYTERRQKMQIIYLKNCLSTFIFSLSYFPLLCGFQPKIEPS